MEKLYFGMDAKTCMKAMLEALTGKKIEIIEEQNEKSGRRPGQGQNADSCAKPKKTGGVAGPYFCAQNSKYIEDKIQGR